MEPDAFVTRACWTIAQSPDVSICQSNCRLAHDVISGLSGEVLAHTIVKQRTLAADCDQAGFMLPPAHEEVMRARKTFDEIVQQRYYARWSEDLVV